VKEAKILVNGGVKELILVAQDLTYYGVDIYKERKLASLLGKLSDIKDLEWIRLQYAYPAAFPVDVLQLIRERENICNYLDIPFQHISDRLLKSMNRAIDKKGTWKLIERIKKEVPGVALRTSLIVGYPGETEKEFNELLDFVRDVQFDRLGVFTYSHEESTKAYKLKDNISAKVKQERADALMHLQESISWEKNKDLIGKTIKVIIDRKEDEFFIGRSEYDSPEVDNEVLIKRKDLKIKIGSIYQAKVIDAAPFDLFAK
jgi:ribosomal protein S12 methylthiotransferase